MSKKANPKKATKTASKDRKNAGPGDLDWKPLFQTFRDAFEWALDIAVAIARSYPEEVAAVERVRTFMRKRINGQDALLDTEDLLFTFGLIMGAIERDLGPIGKRARASLGRTMLFPGADAVWEELQANPVYWLFKPTFRKNSTATA